MRPKKDKPVADHTENALSLGLRRITPLHGLALLLGLMVVAAVVIAVFLSKDKGSLDQRDPLVLYRLKLCGKDVDYYWVWNELQQWIGHGLIMFVNVEVYVILKRALKVNDR